MVTSHTDRTSPVVRGKWVLDNLLGAPPPPMPANVPPLNESAQRPGGRVLTMRERMEELPALIAAELKASAANEGKRITAIHPEAMDKLIAYPWPGNLRELNHTVRTMTLFCEGRVILPEHVVFPPDLKSHPLPATLERNAEPSPNGEANMRDLSLAAAVARVLRPGGRFVCTFSNRCFPTKAIRGWLGASDEERCAIVVRYFELAGTFDDPIVDTRVGAKQWSQEDPLFAVWGRSVHSAP
jgi:hypothetical protein